MAFPELLVMGVLTALGIMAFVFGWFVQVQRANRKAAKKRNRDVDMISDLARLAAADPSSQLNRTNWERVLTSIHQAGFDPKVGQRLIAWFLPWLRRELHAKTFDFEDWLARKNAWALQAFGPGDARDRAAGLCDHIRKELDEIGLDPMDLEEWIDLIFLATDGAWRTGATNALVADALEAKLAKNVARTWPDWRTREPGKAIEHVRDEPRAVTIRERGGRTLDVQTEQFFDPGVWKCHGRRIAPGSRCPVCDGTVENAKPETRPAMPENRVIKEGEAVCVQCGSGKVSHQGGGRGHPFLACQPKAVLIDRLQIGSAWKCCDTMNPIEEPCRICGGQLSGIRRNKQPNERGTA